MLFPADQMASQNNHQEDYKSVLNASSGLGKCFPQHLPQTPVFEENFLIFALQLCLTFRLISYWSSLPTFFQKMHTLCKQNLFMLDLLRYICSEINVMNNAGLQYIIYFFPLLLSSIFLTLHTAKSERKYTHRTESKVIVRSWIYSFPRSYGLVQIRIPFLSLYASHYITITPVIPDGKNLSLNCHGLFGHKGERIKTCPHQWVLG